MIQYGKSPLLHDGDESLFSPLGIYVLGETAQIADAFCIMDIDQMRSQCTGCEIVLQRNIGKRRVSLGDLYDSTFLLF